MKTRVIAATLVVLVACGTPKEPVAARAQSQQMGSLDQLLAPVALYPDSLLAQILMSAGNPDKVSELANWLKANQTVKGTPLQDAAVKAGFDPSLVALVLFPQVVQRMADQISWTTLVGQAFAADRNAVFESIQRLRHQAQTVGTLKTTPQQEVTSKTTSSGQEVIVIEPSNPQVVYVPQYNTQVVYTQAPTTNTVVIQEDNSADAVAAGLIGFTAGIAIGAAMDNSYYYGPYGWHGGGYMYNDAWDDYYDAREDAREDWTDHREDLAEERGDVAKDRQEQRTDRQGTTQEQRTERQDNRQQNRPESQTRSTTGSAQTAQTQRTGRTGSTEARGYGDGTRTQTAATQQRTSSDAFSGYSNGASQRSSSARGNQSRSSAGKSRGGGGGGRRR